VEHDLALGEHPPARRLENGLDVVPRQPLEERPLHAASLCRGGDIANVAAVNDTAAARAQTAAMFFPSIKEHTMKRLLAVLFAAILVTLVVTSIASARTRSSHVAPAARLALHHQRLLL
jgi:hypothetical protein